MAAHNTLCPIYEAQSRARQARNQERLLASVDAMARQMREINRGQIQPEAPSPAPVPQPSVIYAEPIETHNNKEIIQLKEKIKSLEEENKSLREENKRKDEEVIKRQRTAERIAQRKRQGAEAERREKLEMEEMRYELDYQRVLPLVEGSTTAAKRAADALATTRPGYLPPGKIL